MLETSFAGLRGEVVAVVSQQLYINRFRVSFSGSSHFGMDSCTDGPDAAETIVRMHVVGLTLYTLREKSMTQQFQRHRLCRVCI